MVTQSLTLTSLTVLALTQFGCGEVTVADPQNDRPRSEMTPGWTTEPLAEVGASAYDGHGFVVHEWGTNTVVVGSDGSLQRGLHHEQEDLPSFVYDRVTGGMAAPESSVEVKMETPVTYFYSDVPRTVEAAVAFPRGVFTQWYPAVRQFMPAIIGPMSGGASAAWQDPIFDLTTPFGSAQCRQDYTAVADGRLDWGDVEILDRSATPALLEAPLDEFTWSFARHVASNPLRFASAPGGGQSEKFLFYRGLGNFELPVSVTAETGGAVRVTNHYDAAIPRAFLIHVDGDHGAFMTSAAAIAPASSIEGQIPSLDGAEDLDAFSTTLGEEVEKAIDGAGLYHDESVAMVSTWKRQWFRTPGTRVLYLIPQPWTDSSIPLTILPAPERTVRMMMIRVEILSPEIEASDVEAARLLADAETASRGEAHFAALGRFAEPRLRRALELVGDPQLGVSYLHAIESADTRGRTGE